MGVFFGPEACGILPPRVGIKPAPPALEGEVLATGPPGKTLKSCSICANKFKIHLTCSCVCGHLWLPLFISHGLTGEEEPLRILWNMEFIVEIRTCIVVREADDIKSSQGN